MGFFCCGINFQTKLIRYNPPGGETSTTVGMNKMVYFSSPEAIGFCQFLPAVVQVSQNYGAANPETDKN